MSESVGEVDALKKQIADLSVHLKGVAEELNADRKARRLEREQGVSVFRLHVPVVAMLAVLAVVSSAGVTGAYFVADYNNHKGDTLSHADRNEARNRGGIAFKDDVKDAVASEASDREAEVRRTNRAVAQGAHCSPSKVRGEVKCTFQDPETLKLRPP